MRFTPIILAMATVAVAIPLNHDVSTLHGVHSVELFIDSFE